MESHHVKIQTEFIKLRVNGEACTMRGKKMRPGDRACIDGETELVVT